MYFSLHDAKKAVYIFFGILGISLIIISTLQYNSDCNAEDPISSYISSVALLLTGIGNIFFSFEAYLLRNEEDIWQ
ncbi:MAG: hypothetical protein P4L53_19935 [Candidatus Obscuribacterales bacterium]|nr:hypothetical protein [Candidatus Obscuribacterales bacterium]